MEEKLKSFLLRAEELRKEKRAREHGILMKGLFQRFKMKVSKIDEEATLEQASDDLISVLAEASAAILHWELQREIGSVTEMEREEKIDLICRAISVLKRGQETYLI